jgi:exonuclease SbcC
VLLRSARAELEGLADDARRGAALLGTRARAATRTAQLRLQESTGAEIRASLEKLARAMGVPEVTSSETTELALSRLLTAAQAEHAVARKVSEDRDTASEIIVRLRLLAQQRTEREGDAAQRKARLSRLLEAQRTVKRERDMANALRTAASEARTAIVGRVFNERLNAI